MSPIGIGIKRDDWEGGVRAEIVLRNPIIEKLPSVVGELYSK